MFSVDVITHPCPNCNCSVAIFPSRLWFSLIAFEVSAWMINYNLFYKSVITYSCAELHAGISGRNQQAIWFLLEAWQVGIMSNKLNLSGGSTRGTFY